MRHRFLALLALATLPAVAGADTYPRQPGLDVVHYVFRISLGDQSDEITGETTVRVKLTAANVPEVVLDLVSASAGKGMTVSAVRRFGAGSAGAWSAGTSVPAEAPVPAETFPFTHESNRLHVMLPPGARVGDEIAFTVAYKGVPIEGLRLGPNLHGERTMFSDSWPNKARHWIPTLDHPYDKATSEMIVTAPVHYQVISNGLVVEEVDLPGGLRRTHWKQSAPIASWLHALGVARFSVHHAGVVTGVPLQTWVFPQDREGGNRLFEDLSRRSMEFFVERVGPYSYEKLANVQAAGHSGGMELASSIFYGDRNVASGRAPVVHEIAHQWFGDSVTERDWDDVWLSEGFATYFALLFTEHDEGRDAFVDGLRRSRAQVLQLEQKFPNAPVVHHNLDDMTRVLNGLIYQKGGWVLHMLRAEVGTEHFWTAIREYYRRYRDQNASTADLRAIFEQVSGKDLGWFFAQWLTRPGVPKLEGTWRYDAAKKVVEITVKQTQAADPYRLAVDVGVISAAGAPARLERADLTGRSVTITIPANAKPASVTLDPDTWLLMEAGPFVPGGPGL